MRLLPEVDTDRAAHVTVMSSASLEWRLCWWIELLPDLTVWKSLQLKVLPLGENTWERRLTLSLNRGQEFVSCLPWQIAILANICWFALPETHMKAWPLRVANRTQRRKIPLTWKLYNFIMRDQTKQLKYMDPTSEPQRWKKSASTLRKKYLGLSGDK